MEKYIITCVNEEGFAGFYAIDNASGGYPYLSPFLGKARFFGSLEEAKEVFERECFISEAKMSDGTIFPPRMVQIGANLDYKKKRGSCTYKICKIKLETEFAKPFIGEIKQPIGYIY